MTTGQDVRILFDMYELSPSSGKSIGIYVYAVGLLKALCNAMPVGMTLVVVCHGDNLSDLQGIAGPNCELVCVQNRHPGLLQRQWWWRWGAKHLAKRLGCAAYFSPKGFMPGWWGRCRGLKTCVVVHDLIPLWYERHHPSQFGWLERRLVNQGLLRTCRYADEVIAISHATADDIRARSGRAANVTVIHNGLEQAPVPVETSSRGPYILAMSSDLPHKNAATLLEGYRQYRQMDSGALPLVVCGMSGDAPEGVRFVRGLSREALFGLYRGAEIFVYLSRAEGFGYPPLEAMQMGCLSICSDLPVLRETTQSKAIFVDPLNPTQLAKAIYRCLGADFLQEKKALQAQLQSVVQGYDFALTAKGVASVLAHWQER